MWGSGVLEVRKSGVFREVLGGQEAWKSGGLNSRIVTIIFETENLFFPRAEAIRLFLLGNPGRPRLCAWLGQCSEGGLRVVWGLLGFSDSRSRPALSQPGPGLRLSRRVCPAGCRRRPVRVPVPRPARAGALPRCAGAARRLSGRRPVPREPASGGGHVQAEALLPVPAGVLPAAQPPPRTPSALCRPCPQVPASLHAPASCSAWRPGAGRGSGTPWSIPARGRDGAAGPAGSPGPRGGLSRRCGMSGSAEGAGLLPAEGRCSPVH